MKEAQDMIFISHYDSPLGMIYMAADKDGLKGVWDDCTGAFSIVTALFYDWLGKLQGVTGVDCLFVKKPWHSCCH